MRVPNLALLMAVFVVVQVVLMLVMWQVRKPNRGDADKKAEFTA
jgi:cytochrome oxidase assembly protein ShyY1